MFPLTQLELALIVRCCSTGFNFGDVVIVLVQDIIHNKGHRRLDYRKIIPPWTVI